MRLSDLDFERQRAVVREKGRRGPKERVVFFQEKTARALQAWLKVKPASDSETVFLLTNNESSAKS